MNFSFSPHDYNPSPNKSQSNVAKRSPNKRQSYFNYAAPSVGALHPYHLQIAGFQGALVKCSHNETCL